jgi:uncharacterized protein (TIGR00251 family)
MSDHPELASTDGGVLLSVHLQPGAGRTEVIGRQGDAIKVRVAVPPAGERATEAVVDLVSREFALEPADVEVVSGDSSADKQLKLSGVEIRAAERVVERLLAPAPGTRR